MIYTLIECGNDCFEEQIVKNQKVLGVVDQ